ncbi:hypothetical protein BV25DRAFT_1816824 [Artomyces pyxidatus]|uniref:Uncharacterized protein n=1 Tax=Artomyces pyxidatus TaxID=48021 RepID=A0ACB8SFA5_9AGAM|nr:hypothetical protein BV25DRAFT_1816824 [Artomyces pyxidatus]
MDEDEAQRLDTRAEDAAPLQNPPTIVKFGGKAGAPVQAAALPSFYQYLNAIKKPGDHSENNPYHPFESEIDWETADWAKEDGPGSNAFTRLLKIPGMHDRLDLSYKTSDELNTIIDTKLPPRPQFHRHEVEVDGEKFDFYLRDTLECIRALYGAPHLALYLVHEPEKHYTARDKKVRVFSDMHTSRWWWTVQELLEAQNEGATIIPVIISSDKTQLTLFRNKSAYPVYLTIGNLPKEIRRKPSLSGQILLGYLPVTRLDHIKDDDARRRGLANLFHACMSKAMSPLKAPGVHGLQMADGHGVVRRCHPILAAFVGDYPEQVLVTGVKTNRCPKGVLDPDLMGENVDCTERNLEAILDALATLDQGPIVFVEACEQAGIKPLFHPFWEGLPYVNIFQSITPDILHQLYQGVVKHLVSWIREAYGDAAVDARFMCMPPNHNLRQFAKGISHLSRVSGAEHQDICRVLLGAIIDLPLPGGESPTRIVRAVRALLDFVYLAQFPTHTKATLAHLQDALNRFHANKSIFIDLGIRDHFNFPKMHSLTHYVESVRLFGTADNFNTSYSERLHIDFTKDAYRASNRKDEYPQMTLWLRRREQMHIHRLFIQWRLDGQPAPALSPPKLAPRLHIQIARNPSAKAVSFNELGQRYGAVDFKQALAEYIIRRAHPTFTVHQVVAVGSTLHIPFNSVAVYNKMKFWNPDAQDRKNVPETLDCIHVRPAYKDTQGRKVPGRFDTALVKESAPPVQPQGGAGQQIGVRGLRVAQVRVIFSLSQTAAHTMFGGEDPGRLAYIEWFSRFPRAPDRNHNMYRITRSYNGQGRRQSCIIPVTLIQRSIHLYPKFGPTVPDGWTSSNVLERCNTFHVSSFVDRHTYITVV